MKQQPINVYSLKPFSNVQALDQTNLIKFWELGRLMTAAFGMVANLINICVFLNPRLKRDSYKYMLTSSVSNFFYLTSLFVANLIVYCNCSCNETYLAALYTIAVIDYLSSCLAIFRIFLEITLTCHIYCVLTDVKWIHSISTRLVIVVLFLFSLVYYIPVLFFKDIKNDFNINTLSIVYSAELNEAGKSILGRTTIILLQLIRLILANVVLAFINFSTLIKFKKRFIRKKVGILIIANFMYSDKNDDLSLKSIRTDQSKSNQIASDSPTNALKFKFNRHTKRQNLGSKATRNLTLMVIFTSLAFTVCTTPYAVRFILLTVSNSIGENLYFSAVSVTLLFFSHGFNIFIYVAFNKLYRKILLGYLKNILIFWRKFFNIITEKIHMT